MKKEFLQSIKIVFLGGLLALGMGYVFAAYSGPTAGPVDNNPEPPITISKEGQGKIGGLSVGKETAPEVAKISTTGWDQFWGSDVKPVLDVEGIVNVTRAVNIRDFLSVGGGMVSKGAARFAPADTDADKNGNILMVLDNVQDINDPVFSVNTSDKSSRTNGTSYSNNIKTDFAKIVLLDTYELLLQGKTNIGSNTQYCKMTLGDMTNHGGCPSGTYLSYIDSNSPNGTYAQCRSFSTISSISSKNCYSAPPIYMHFASYKDNSLTNDCSGEISAKVYATGGTGSLSYVWEKQTKKDVWTKICSNNSSCIAQSLGDRQNAGYNAKLRVTVSDQYTPVAESVTMTGYDISFFKNIHCTEK